MYLYVDSSESDAGDRVRQWRAKCREERIPCIVIVRKGSYLDVSVSQPGSRDFARYSMDEFTRHPRFNSGNAQGGPDGLDFELREFLEPEVIYEICNGIFRSRCSEERRLAQLRESSPMASHCRNSGGGVSVFAGASSFTASGFGWLILPDEEYRVLCALTVALKIKTPLRTWPFSIDHGEFVAHSKLPLRFPESTKSGN